MRIFIQGEKKRSELRAVLPVVAILTVATLAKLGTVGLVDPSHALAGGVDVFISGGAERPGLATGFGASPKSRWAAGRLGLPPWKYWR